MKGIASIVAAFSLFAASSAYAGNADIDIHVHDVEIYQAQDGVDLTQQAAIASVNDQYAGTANLYVHNAKIYQKQKGQGGKQSATIATVCDCQAYKP